MKRLESYVDENGNKPFDDWIESQTIQIQARVDAYIRRVALGGAKNNIKRLKNSGGVFEIRIDTGPGYRVYFGEVGNTMILLLIGGSKGSQAQDIAKAEMYWRKYNEKV